MIVDCHIHMGQEGIESPDYILALMDEHGIDYGVVFPCRAPAPDNRAHALRARATSPRLIPFAWINPNFGSAAVEEVRALAGEGLIRGVKLHPLLHAFFPNREPTVGFVQAVAELNLPVLIHSGHAPFSLPGQIGALAQRVPKATIIMDHMGLNLGYVEDAIDVADACPNIILGTTAMPFHLLIHEAVERLGSDRVVYGSDAPYIHPGPEMLRVRVAGLSPADEAAVLGGTMAKLLGLDERRDG